MINILVSADWHINLHKKKVKYNWSVNRFKQFFTQILELEQSHDIHIISGDIFDKKPEPDEICLFLDYINSVKIPTYIIPGNHEATKKGSSFLEHFCEHNAINNSLVHIFTKNTRIKVKDQQFYFFPYGEVETKNLLAHQPGEILVSHIRGEVPPHITEEFDFERLRPWNLILLGDLHFYHRHRDFNAWYPGSPLNTSFDRDTSRDYGVISIEFSSINQYKVNFINLDLPKLIRKTVKNKEQMKPDDKHYVIYEITGSLDELAAVENSELLDKKIAVKPSSQATLNLHNLSLVEEVEQYLQFKQIEQKDLILNEFKQLGIVE
jgi:DNA repair exonuclease SbcCD nuclease subunit